MDDENGALVHARHLMLHIVGVKESRRVVVQVAETLEVIDQRLAPAAQVGVVENAVSVAVHLDAHVAWRHRIALA